MIKKMKEHKKLTVLLIVILVIAIVGGVFYFRAKKGAEEIGMEETGVPAIALSEQDLTSTITTSGTVESANVTDVTTEATTPIKELKVSLGERVEEGQVLCTLDAEDIQEQINDLQKADASAAQDIEIGKREAAAALTSAQNGVAQAQATLAEAQAAYNEEKALLDAGDERADKKAVAEAKAAVDAAQGTLSQANEAVTTAQIGVDKANNATVGTNKDLKKLQQQLANTTITASQAGIITQLNVSKGSIPNGSLMKIEDDSALKVTVTIKEKDIMKLKEGMKATIKSDALGDEQEFKGTVDKVINFSSSSAAADGSTSTTGYSATIALEPGTPLLLGMKVKAEILLNESGKQLAVPYDAIGEDGGKNFVYVAKEAKDGMYKVERVNVELGDSNDYYTAISGKGLAAGDIIVNYPDMVGAGDEIEIYMVTEDTDFLTDETAEE